VIRFPQRAVAAIDVRGGSPGTYDNDGLRLGYQRKRIDAVVFAGGSIRGCHGIGQLQESCIYKYELQNSSEHPT
jgi:L-aminopeptidase/D-esterase-like protein